MLRKAIVYIRAWFVWNVQSRWKSHQLQKKNEHNHQHQAPVSALPALPAPRKLTRSTAITRPSTTRRPFATRSVQKMTLVLHDTKTNEVFARFVWDGQQTTIDYLDPLILLPETRSVFLEILGRSLQEHGPYSPEGQCLIMLAANFGDREEFQALLSSDP